MNLTENLSCAAAIWLLLLPAPAAADPDPKGMDIQVWKLVLLLLGWWWLNKRVWELCLLVRRLSPGKLAKSLPSGDNGRDCHPAPSVAPPGGTCM